MAIYSASSATELYSLLANTVTGGDTIELATGTYSYIGLSNYSFTSFVTITSADANYGAKISKFYINNCNYIKFTKLDFLKTAAGAPDTIDKIIELRTYDHITFDDVKVRCSNASNLWYNGIYKSANYVGTYLTVSNSLFENVNGGIWLYKGSTGLVDNVTISGNEFNDIHEDANKYSGVRYLLFEENYAHDWRQNGTKHNDFLQMEGSAAHWILRRNIMLTGNNPGVTVDIQGLYIQQVPVDDILIEDNIIYTHHENGIKVNTGSTNVIIRRNSCIFDPTDDGSTQDQCRIFGPAGMTKTDNLECNDTWGLISGSNVIMGAKNPTDPFYYADLITNPLGGIGTTLADLVAVTGTAAEGKGAAAYLAELLGAASPPVISGPPVLSGLETSGQTLTVTPQSTTGSTPITHTFDFYNTVDGLRQSSTAVDYLLTDSDIGDQFYVIHKAINNYGGDSDQSTLTGVIGAAVTNPTLVLLSPADNSQQIALNTTLEITLNKNIAFGASGTVKLYNLTTGVGPDIDPNSQVGQWTVANDAGGAMVISGAKLTVTRAGLLREGHEYCATISPGTLVSTDGGSYAGITNSTGWNFTAFIEGGGVTPPPSKGVRVGNKLLAVGGKIILVE